MLILHFAFISTTSVRDHFLEDRKQDAYATLPGQPPSAFVDHQPRVPGILIIDPMHLVDRVEEADDERSAE